MLRRPTLAIAVAAALTGGVLVAPSATAGGIGVAPPNVITVEQEGLGDLPDQSYRAVATGYWSTYGLTMDHRVIAAGVASADALDVPVSLDDKTVVAIAAGYRHGLALDSDGNVTPWGYHDEDNTRPVTVPAAVQDADIVQIAAGNDHDLALTSTGTVLAWGDVDFGAIDVPDLSGVTVTSIATGEDTSAVVTSTGSVVSWGGAGAAPAELTGKTVVSVDVGNRAALALTTEGKLYAWGDGATGVPAIPEAVASATVTAFGVGDYRAMAATSDGVIHEWGLSADEAGQPPNGTETVVDLQVDRYQAVASYAALGATTAPVVTGTVEVGETLTATTGTWTTTPDAVHYAWYAGADPVGSDANTLLLAPAMSGKQVSVVVSATGGGLGGQTRVLAAGLVAPTDFTAPPTASVTGPRRAGSTLTATVGTDAVPMPDSYRYQWYVDGKLRKGSTAATYRLRNGDVGNTLSVMVSPQLTGYTGSSVTASAGVIGLGPAKLSLTAPATVRTGSTFTLKVTGLTSGEKFTVKLDGKVVKTGTAGPSGSASVPVKVPASARPGKRPLVVVGSFPDRTGARTVTVAAR